MKRKPKLENYKNYLRASQLENKIIHLNNNKTEVKSLIENRKEFMANRKIILKSQQRLKRKWHNVFAEETNKITLSLDNHERIPLIDSVETYIYVTKKT